MTKDETLEKIKYLAIMSTKKRKSGNHHKAFLLIWDIKDLMESIGIEANRIEFMKILGHPV